jgi:hypothetical protein
MITNYNELGKILQQIALKLLNNQKLCKLLRYTNTNPLEQTDIADTMDLFQKNIFIVPKVECKDSQSRICIILNRADVSQNTSFSGLTVTLSIFCPLESFVIDEPNAQLRPFAIMEEINKTLNKKEVGGLGSLVGGDFEFQYTADDIAYYLMLYSVDIYT